MESGKYKWKLEISKYQYTVVQGKETYIKWQQHQTLSFYENDSYHGLWACFFEKYITVINSILESGNNFP